MRENARTPCCQGVCVTARRPYRIGLVIALGRLSARLTIRSGLILIAEGKERIRKRPSVRCQNIDLVHITGEVIGPSEDSMFSLLLFFLFWSNNTHVKLLVRRKKRTTQTRFQSAAIDSFSSRSLNLTQ